jgi:glycosyltransferase involved in cell wall biosynthesis
MRILVCATEAPLPPLNGLRLQVRSIVGCLAEHHEVCVVAFRWPDQYGEPPEGVELVEMAPVSSALRSRLRGWSEALLSRRPVESVRLTPRMAARVATLRREREFDIAHVTIGALARIAPALKGLPAVIAPLDAWQLNAATQASAASGLRAIALRAHEQIIRHHVRRAYRPYRRVVLVTEEDAAETRRLDPRAVTSVIRNGVDTDVFRPAWDVPAASPARIAPEPGLIVFTGAMHAPSNEQAAVLLGRSILPLVRLRRPQARLVLAGRAPGPRVLALAGLEGVEVAADVPDLREWLWRAEVFACPMTSGTGIKNKLLEALACGVPCVASPLACQGITARDGSELLVAQPGEPFAQAVVELLDSAARREALGAAGRAYVVEHHSWHAAAAAYEQLYRDVIDEAA